MRIVDKKPVLYVSTNSETIKLLRDLFGKYGIELVVTDDLECADRHLRGKRKYYTALIIEACTSRSVEPSSKQKKQNGASFAEQRQLEGERVIILYDNIAQCPFITRFPNYSRPNLSETKDFLAATILGLSQMDSK